MSKYRCYGCEEEHFTENVVSYCAFCVNKIKLNEREKNILIKAQLEEAVKELQEIRLHCGKLNA